MPSFVHGLSSFRDRELMTLVKIMANGNITKNISQGGSVNFWTDMEKIFKLTIKLFRCAVGLEFLLMDDNAWPRRAYVVSKYLQAEDITDYTNGLATLLSRL